MREPWRHLAEGGDALRPAGAHRRYAAGRRGRECLADEAHRELGAARTTRYDHHVLVDEAAGSFRYDCSGFVDYALQEAAPGALEALRAVMRKKRPQAETYVALLEDLDLGERKGAWRRLPVVSRLAPGDVVAWRRPPGSHDPNTGHVMIVELPPTRRDGTEWIVSIIDSSNGHGGKDPRHAPEATGLGRGSVVLVTDEAGHPTAFRWKTSSSGLVHATTVVLGRVQ